MLFSFTCLLIAFINFTGSVEEAICLYKTGLQIIKDSKYVEIDDEVLEKLRIDLAELLHVTGR